MEIKDLDNALEVLKKDLEGKSAKEVKTAIDAFKQENEPELKNMKEDFEAELKKLQDHANKLDIKIKGKVSGKIDEEKVTLKSLIKENFESISTVRKGNKVSIETKAVADMTLGVHLTGDQPRDYSMNVAMVPRQLLNFSDLIQSVSISGGTYTFPRETGKEGTVTTQTEGSLKAQNDYDLAMIDVNTDFIAGFAVYSKKMANNLPFLESFLPDALRRDYWKGENTIFNTALAAAATASTEIITGKNKIEMLINEVARLEGLNFSPNGFVVSPADFYSILVTEKSTGAGYGLPGVVTFDNGQLRINGIPLFKATWLAANKYYVADWTRVKKIVTEGLSVEFSTEDSDNFRKNNITARVEAQVGLAIERPDAVIYGDFTAV